MNECEENNGGCTQVCVDAREGYSCQCNAGYRLIGKYTCEGELSAQLQKICHCDHMSLVRHRWLCTFKNSHH